MHSDGAETHTAEINGVCLHAVPGTVMICVPALTNPSFQGGCHKEPLRSSKVLFSSSGYLDIQRNETKAVSDAVSVKYEALCVLSQSICDLVARVLWV